MKIATWNVNSMNVRLPHVLEWLQSHEPDVLVLQEIKQLTEKFPADALAEIGYQSLASGQKTYNGVAVVSKEPANDPVTDFPGFEDPQRRILATTIGDIRPADTIRRASSATRANQAIESDTRSASSGSSDSHTAVPSGSSWTDAACSAGRWGTSILIRATAPYDTGESCHPLRVPSSPMVRKPE